MKLSEILQLDFREKESKWLVNKALRKLPFFKDYDMDDVISVEDLEKAVTKVRKRFPLTLSYIMPGPMDNNYYSFMIKRTDNHEWLTTVYALTMYEGFAKVLLYMFSYAKNNLRKDSE